MSEQLPQAGTNVFPALRYRDAPAAIEWLVRAFGFQKLMAVPGPDGSIIHAELRLGSDVIMLGTARDDGLNVKSPLDTGAVSHSIYVCVDNPDAHYRRARAAGAEIVRDLEDTDYGSRGYTARDPEGHLWSFGTYRPTLTPQEA